jgi:uncharacterized protein
VESCDRVIARLGLAPMPVEGGWWRRIAVSPEVDADGRPAWSDIHYLMTTVGFSAMHRLRTAAETWVHLDGAAAEMLLLEPGGEGRLVVIGHGEEQRSVRIPAGVWQGARPLGCWSLFTCRVEPAWRDDEFELGEASALGAEFPRWANRIRERVREPERVRGI